MSEPCPFCASDLVYETSGGFGDRYIKCEQCGARGPIIDDVTSLDAWNIRGGDESHIK